MRHYDRKFDFNHERHPYTEFVIPTEKWMTYTQEEPDRDVDPEDLPKYVYRETFTEESQTGPGFYRPLGREGHDLYSNAVPSKVAKIMTGYGGDMSSWSTSIDYNAAMIPFFKVLKADNTPNYASGIAAREPVTFDEEIIPGDWMPLIEGKLTLCSNGYHITNDPSKWIRFGTDLRAERIWLVEPREVVFDYDMFSNGKLAKGAKFVCRTYRLLKDVTETFRKNLEIERKIAELHCSLDKPSWSSIQRSILQRQDDLKYALDPDNNVTFITKDMPASEVYRIVHDKTVCPRCGANFWDIERIESKRITERVVINEDGVAGEAQQDDNWDDGERDVVYTCCGQHVSWDDFIDEHPERSGLYWCKSTKTWDDYIEEIFENV